MTKARRDVILAYQMNGEDLSPSHGFPLRAVVPGWYGMASVKWLTRLVVLDRPYNGFFQSLDYAYFDRVSGAPSLTPITAMQVKAQIARPFHLERIKSSSLVKVQGAAWSGEAGIAKVEFSSDGTSWKECTLIGDELPNSWRLFEHNWTAPQRTGIARLSVRATDTVGNTQPTSRSIDRRTYMINHVIPTEVHIV
jgi:DMSO/TMAO reductase YedYZ molybdopterin-dependent catalytic subunit